MAKNCRDCKFYKEKSGFWGFVIEEARPKTFRTIGWKLVDLSKIFVSMKPEFNTDNRELYKREAIITENWIDS